MDAVARAATRTCAAQAAGVARSTLFKSVGNDAARMSDDELRARLVELTAQAMEDPEMAALVDEEVRRRKEA